MEFLKQQAAKIQAQLGGLNATQRMLAMSLVAIIVMTLVWWARYAGTAEYEALLDQSLKADDITRITGELKLRGMDYKVNGDRVLVPADKKAEAFAAVTMAQALPADISDAMDEVIKQSNPFISNQQQAQAMEHAKATVLGHVITRLDGSIAMANVIFAGHSGRSAGLGERADDQTAAVNIQMRRGAAATQQIADAAGALVAGAFNMKKSHVSMVIGGRTYTLHDAEEDGSFGGGASSNWLELKTQSEKQYREKLLAFLSTIPNVQVFVNVDPNLTSTKTTTHTPDAKSTVVKPLEETSSTEESNQGNQPGGQTGFVPNGSASIDQQAAGDSSKTTSEKNESKNKVEIGMTDQEKFNRGGEAKVVSAAVQIPRSYYAAVYKKNSGSKDEPRDEQLQPLIEAGLKQCREQVRTCLNLESDQAISVGIYTDIAPDSESSEVGLASASPVPLGMMSHVKEIGIGALALVSLFMMAMMVKKSGPRPAVAAAVVEKPAPRLSGMETSIGDASAGSATLDGMEIDEESLKAQQMLEQVETMVKEDPDAAASLVKRWMSRT